MTGGTRKRILSRCNLLQPGPFCRGMMDGSPGLRRLAEYRQATGYRFVTPTPATHARVNARSGNQLARTITDVFGWSRSFGSGMLPPVLFDLAQQAGVLEPAADRWRSTVRVSSLGPSLYLHSAFPTTTPDAVFFGPDTYRFCAAVERALADCREVARAVDICSGAGPGAITIARAHPGAVVFAADINVHALALSRINAAVAGAHIEAVHSDLLDGLDGEFDLIVANPPYLNDPAQRTYRHGGGQHGQRLSLRILDAALPRLRPGGRLVLYTGVAIVGCEDPVLSAVTTRLADWDGRWSYLEADPDVFGEELDQPAYADVDRIAAVVLDVTRT